METDEEALQKNPVYIYMRALIPKPKAAAPADIATMIKYNIYHFLYISTEYAEYPAQYTKD